MTFVGPREVFLAKGDKKSCFGEMHTFYIQVCTVRYSSPIKILIILWSRRDLSLPLQIINLANC